MKTNQQIIEACNSSSTMTEAAQKLSIDYKTLRTKSKLLGCFKPNQGYKGNKKNKKWENAIPLSEILKGKHPSYNTNRLRIRLIEEGIKEAKCEGGCNGTSWLGGKMPLELHHKDGVSTNHKKENLLLVCPNCHTLTENYKSKNKKTPV